MRGKKIIGRLDAFVKSPLLPEKGVRRSGDENETGGNTGFFQISAGLDGVGAGVIELSGHEEERWVRLVEVMPRRSKSIGRGNRGL